MNPERRPESETLLPEALAAYEDKHVLAAVRGSEWFTPQFLIDVYEHEPYPDRAPNFRPFEDPFLGDFLRADAYLSRKKYKRYFALWEYLLESMVSPDGHIYPLNQIPFISGKENVLRELEGLGVRRDHEVDRAMFGEIDGNLMCIISPEELRRKVVRCICSWGEEYIERKKDVLVWSQVVRIGALHFVEKK